MLFAGHRPALLDSSYGADKPLFHRAGMADPSDVGVALALQKTIWPLLHKHKVGGVSVGRRSGDESTGGCTTSLSVVHDWTTRGDWMKGALVSCSSNRTLEIP